jgi:hypothetical protein
MPRGGLITAKRRRKNRLEKEKEQQHEKKDCQ